MNLLKKILNKSEQNLILFGAMNGKYYGDNSKYLFEWILRHKPNIDVIWITGSRFVYSDMKERGLPVLKAFSLRAVIALWIAKAAVFTNSLKDLAAYNFLFPKDIKLIALRHGRSVKKVRFARQRNSISVKEKRIREHEGSLIKYAISTSDFISKLQEECLKIGLDKQAVTGYPRNDVLLNVPPDSCRKWDAFIGGKKYSKIFLYAPTWRNGRKPTIFFPFDDFDKNYFLNFLKNNNILFLMRPHVNDGGYDEVSSFLRDFPVDCNIKIADHKHFSDPNTLLPFIDVLISDYSSIYHDYLLLNRPIFFIPYDYQEFAVEDGFLYDYYSNIPGPVINSFSGLIDNINLILRNNDTFSDKRSKLCNLIHYYKDGNSCERVFDLIIKILDNND